MGILETLKIFGAEIGLSATDPRLIVANLIRLALEFVGIVFVLMILSAGVSFMFSGGEKEKTDKAKKTLLNAFVGLIIILSAYSIVVFVLSAVGKETVEPNQIFSTNSTVASSSSIISYSNDYNSLQEDINGDGKKENIALTVERLGGLVTTTLHVNDFFVIVPGYDPVGFFGIVDIDNGDKIKEIAVIDMGPSDDYTTSFYSFDGANLLLMGTISGSYKEMKFDGLGKLTTQTRGKILDTWFYADDFIISKNHELVHAPKNLYVRDTAVTLLTSLPLNTSPTNSQIITTLKKDEAVKITGCDDIMWCVVEKANGVKGWFAVEDFDSIIGTGLHAQEVFSGLSNAG